MRAAWLLALLALGVKATNEDADDDADDVAQSLLQTSLRVAPNLDVPKLCVPIRKYYDPHEPNRVVAEWCGINISNPATYGPAGPQQARDLDRPLAEVQREHPGNLYPYFGELNLWLGPSMQSCCDGKGYVAYKRSLTLPPRPSTDGAGPAVTFTWDGLQIHTHLDSCLAGDDPYCYSLGWMQGQALDRRVNMRQLMDNATAWANLGIAECQRMKEEFDFKDEEITLGGHIRETNDMYEKTERTCNWHEPSPGPRVTVRDFKKHAYAKCFLNNVTTEMAYCYLRGCVLEGHKIGHASECN